MKQTILEQPDENLLDLSATVSAHVLAPTGAHELKETAESIHIQTAEGGDEITPVAQYAEFTPLLDLVSPVGVTPSPLKPALAGFALSVSMVGLMWWQKPKQVNPALQGQDSQPAADLDPGKQPSLPLRHSQTADPQVAKPKSIPPTLITGLGVAVGLAGLLVMQEQRSVQQQVELIPPSSPTLTATLQQNYEQKLAEAERALQSNSLEIVEQPGIVRHTVQPGETLWQLTQMYQVDVAAITIPNGLTGNTELEPGQQLDIPTQPGLIYTVKPGDTLESIAARFQVTEAEIVAATPLTSRHFLRIGQNILLPGDVAELIKAQKALNTQINQAGDQSKQAQDPAEAASQQVTAAKPSGPITHTVSSGETIERIAAQYGVSQREIIRANRLSNPHWLKLGQKLQIPVDADVVVSVSLSATPKAATPSPTVKPTTPTPKPATPKPQAATPKPATPKPQTGPIVHTVSSGETIESIAAEYGVSQRAIIQANQLTNPHWLNLGQKLQIPADPEDVVSASISATPKPAATPSPTVKPATPKPATPKPQTGPIVHTVSSGETIESIAAEYGVSQRAMIQANQLSNPHWLKLGQKLQIPTGDAAVATSSPTPAIPKAATPAATVKPATPKAATPKPATPQAQTPAATATPATPKPQVEPSVTAETPKAASPLPTTKPVTPQPETIAPLAPATPKAPPPLATVRPATPTPIPQPTPTPVVLATPKKAPPPLATVRPATPTPLPQVTPTPVVSATPKPPPPLATLGPKAPPPLATPRVATPTPQPQAVAPLPPAATPQAVPPAATAKTRFIWPVAGQITSGFGWRGGRIHAGVDIPGPVGSPIMAVMDGTVIFAGFGRDGYGNRVDIKHPNGLVTRYAHGSKIYVVVGQQVAQGQTIMSRGSTGWSTGPHLHFEVRPGGGTAVDPRPYLY